MINGKPKIAHLSYIIFQNFITFITYLDKTLTNKINSNNY